MTLSRPVSRLKASRSKVVLLGLRRLKAPAVVSGYLTHAWLYVVGPLTGALLAVGADRLLRPSSPIPPSIP